MKIKLALLFCLFIMSILTLSAQSVGDKQISEIESTYLIIYEIRDYASGAVEAKLDYGQRKKRAKEGWIRNQDGKLYNFNSMVALLNFFDKMGYEVEESFPDEAGKDFEKLILTRKD